jgi:serine/threonine protein kinase
MKLNNFDHVDISLGRYYFIFSVASIEDDQESCELKEYHVLHEIGNGSYSKVKVVVKKKTGERMACKIIEKKRGLNQRQINQILREVDILKSLNHVFPGV